MFSACGGALPESELLSLPPFPPGFVPSPTSAAADPDTTLTLDDAIDRVLARNAALHGAQEFVASADAERVQAGAWPNPTAFVEAEGFGGDRPGFDDAEITIGVGLPLEVFGQRGSRKNVATAALNAARARYGAVERELVAQTRMAFHEVLAAQEELRIAGERLRVVEETATTVTKQVETGKQPPLLQNRAEVDREVARSLEYGARVRLASAQVELATLWGGRGDQMAASGVLRMEYPTIDARTLTHEIISTHPDLLESAWRVEEARKLRQLRGREVLPTIEPNIGYRHLRESDEFDWVGGLSLGLPLFDRKGGAKQAAAHAEAGAIAEAENVRVRLLRELDLALRQLDEAHARLMAFTAEISPRAEESLRLARRGFESGKFGHLELLDAQRVYIDVEAGRAEALIAFDRALVRLESILGRSLEQP